MIIPLKDLWEIAKDVAPKEWKNNTSVFEVPEMDLLFKCNAKGIGRSNVWVYDHDDEVAFIQGSHNDSEGVPVEVGSNRRNLSTELLWEMFHMARCQREFERTDDVRFKRGFEFFRERTLRIWEEGAG